MAHDDLTITLHLSLQQWTALMGGVNAAPDGDVKNEAAAVLRAMSCLIENKGKNIEAMRLGQLGGWIGGRVRAKTLSPERRTEIARKAANARWNK